MLLPSLLLLLALPSAAQTPQLERREFRIDHFSISLPAGWEQMPAADLKALTDHLKAVAPQTDPQIYNYGFRSEASPGQPRILIQVKAGRWSETFFEEASKLPRAKGSLKHDVAESSPTLAASQPEIGEMRWDPDRMLLWLHTQTSNEEGGTQALTGVHLTNDGTIQVYGHTTAAEWDRYAGLFSEIIGSVEIDPAYRYVPRSALRIFLEDNTWLPWVAGSIVLTLLVAFMARRLGRQRTA